MKIKSASQTANLGKEHAYLGHFRKEKYINQGHNDGPNLRDPYASRSGPSYSVEPTIDASEDWASYGFDASTKIPLSKNTSLGLSVGGSAGRGYGRNKGYKSPFTPRGSAEFEWKF